MDTISSPPGESNDLERLLLRRFPLGWVINREFHTIDHDDDDRQFRVNLDTGQWKNIEDPDMHGDTVVSLFAVVGAPAAAVQPGPPPTAEWWLTRDIKPPEALLGEVITTTSRTFIGGPSGIGKSHLALAMAAGMAIGQGFAHWKSSRPVRTLYVDGEMPRDLVLSLLKDLKRRMGDVDLANLLVLCREDFEDMAPLNTREGHDFILARVKSWDAEAVFFDNRMSLTAGDMKDEEGWLAAMETVRAVSKAGVAQIWIDHTGHETGRIYGTKTKEWSFDNVALLTKVGQPGEIAFSLEFTKARRRRPETRQDFATVTFTLAGDQWTTDAAPATQAKAKMSPMCQQFYRALMEPLIEAGTSTTTRTAWYAHCVRLGLATAINPEDTWRTKDSKLSKFRKYMAELRAIWLIGVDGETVNLLQNPRTVTP